MENLEENYHFQWDETQENCGVCGSVIYGKLINNTTQEEKFVALKKAISKTLFKQQVFENERCVLKMLQQNPQDGVVKYYGTIHIDNDEYIVMEDLKKDNYQTIRDMCTQMLLLENDINMKRAQTLDNLNETIYHLETKSNN